jgi:two-component system phosphate regulon sensor histidine kinase PhoR
MNIFELEPQETGPGEAKPSLKKGLGSALLVRNAQWFTRVRWIVVLIFLTTGLAGRLFQVELEKLHLALPAVQLWSLALVLAGVNLLFRLQTSRFDAATAHRRVKVNIWLQIVADLLVVTLLVHFIGSTDTFIAFTYLFHIALACIFFPARDSLLVTLLAGCLYLGSVGLEVGGVWPAAGIWRSVRPLSGGDPLLKVMLASSAVFVWFVVWYFVSTLSEQVREREQRLSAANDQLLRADRERTREVLVTTHNLKAPFVGIESNIQVLKHQYWQDIPAHVRTIIEHIDLRSQTLRERIRAILILGDLKSHSLAQKKSGPVNVAEIIRAAQEEVRSRAGSREIALTVKVPEVTVQGDRDQFVMLFVNLLVNAISYSHPGGGVDVAAEESETELRVKVRDHGIGIREDALPHIFEDYYRTSEAAQFNSQSTGLGLAIVKEIARNNGLRIRVESQVDEGTEFTVIIPKGT